MKTTSYVKHDVWQMLHCIGGCGADPDTWADGWDKAIDTAIGELDKLPTVELVDGNKIYLKPCPFCGEREILSRVSGAGIGKYCFEICCKACDCQMTMVLNLKRSYATFDEILEFSRQAADKWNRRYNERKEAESEVEENG